MSLTLWLASMVTNGGASLMPHFWYPNKYILYYRVNATSCRPRISSIACILSFSDRYIIDKERAALKWQLHHRKVCCRVKLAEIRPGSVIFSLILGFDFLENMSLFIILRMMKSGMRRWWNRDNGASLSMRIAISQAYYLAFHKSAILA